MKTSSFIYDSNLRLEVKFNVYASLHLDMIRL